MLATLLLSVWLAVPAAAAAEYAFPHANRYAATILGTPPQLQAELPVGLPLRIGQVTVFPTREVPAVLWLSDRLSYSYSLQPGPAPLVFVIAGTGANLLATKMLHLQKVLYQAGCHVVGLPSPTHPNFLVAASRSGVPGVLAEDAADLYRAMQLILRQLQPQAAITGHALAGYSLGGAQAAYVAHLDETVQTFNFRKVLMINPPVNLFDSVERLDWMLEGNIPGGLDNLDQFLDQMFDRFSAVYRRGDFVDLNNQFLYAVYQEGAAFDDAMLEAVIGADFRFSCTNLAFSADVLTRAGYAVPKWRTLSRGDSLTDYYKVLSRLSFADYIDGLLLPFWQAVEPGLTRAGMTARVDLRSIETYLRSSPKLALMHNVDDVILGPGDIDWFRDVFGARAIIYPRGGHCGNLDYRDNVAEIIRFFRE
jgi:pimeloyl-ACP methyl ester carboxylesterase